MGPIEPEQPNMWHIHLDKVEHNWINPENAEMWNVFLHYVERMAQKEEQMEQAELARLEALDAQVQGDHHPQALEWILNARP